jgi:enoyl-CoA hydratase/carnithine racemase
MESGDFYRPEQSLQMGMVDQVLPLQQVRSQAVEKVRLLGSMNQQTYALIKRNRVQTIEAQFLACREEKQEAFIQCWYSNQARQQLKKATEKFQ